MSDYDNLLGVDMTVDVNLPVQKPVQKQTVTEHHARGKISSHIRTEQSKQQMPDKIPHANHPEYHVSRNDEPRIDTDFSMEREV